jgi:crotonobetainyl-CoA:carnitine CoA-transferase CaiB-like acyl-CoA transferase
MGFFALSETELEAKPMADPGYELYKTADGTWLTTCVANEDPYWDQLCKDVGLPELAGLDRPARIARRAELRQKIGAQIAKHPRAHWEAIFEASGQMWGRANAVKDLAADP